MCGRYALYGPATRLSAHFEVDFEEVDFGPRYNLAPLQFAPVIRNADGARHVAMLRWGLLPGWAKDPAMAARLINARSETAAEKPSFRSAFRSRRCLVPADGFYEWKAVAGGKQPHFISRRDGVPMALAGLWEHWSAPGGEALATFTLLTTAANAMLANLHERMPVILPAETWGLWLNAERTPAQLMPLMCPLAGEELVAWPVSRRVGNVRNDDEGLLAPAAGEDAEAG